MRKLNKKNKTYIIILSILAFILLGAVLVFIGFKIKDLNTKYDIASGSIVYNSDDELVKFKEAVVVKKDLLGKYIAINGSKKINVGSNPVFFTSNIKEIKLLGTFYEVLKNGEVNKLKGETIISSTAASRIFKINDRKYLVIASAIKSKDGSLAASDYLHINIDKAGNGYLFNDEVNIKTFSDLEIITDSFSFRVNEEILVIGEEEIDLAKINGSTNEYIKPEEPGDGEGNGDGSGTGDGTGTGEDNPGGGSDIYPGDDQTPEEKPEPEIIDKYFQRKTTITSVETTASSATINYIVFDPFAEYKGLYVDVLSNGVKVNTYTLDASATKYVVKNLKANEEYRFNFYYSYETEVGEIQNVMFDAITAQTKNINGKFTLEKTSNNSVRYILKIDDNYLLDSANVALYIDDVLIATDIVDTKNAASKEGFVSTINFEATGSFGVLVLTDCIYNGAPVEIDASYKYKL